MIREKIEARHEREIIAFSILNTDYLRAIYPIAKLELFQSSYARTVFAWVLDYFRAFNVAPKKDIQELYVSHKLEIDEDEEVVATFLQSLSDEYDKEINNLEFAIKQAENWLRGRSIELLTEELRDFSGRKDFDAAEKAIAGFNRVVRTQSDSIDVLTDFGAAQHAFSDDEEELFQFPGALGAVCGPFKRSDFVSYLALVKGGKSLWLWESAKQALCYGHKVLFVSLEMPRNQMLRRIWMSLTRKPKRTRMVKIPKFIEMDDSTPEHPMWMVESSEKEVEAISPSPDFFKEWKHRYRKYFKGGDIKLKCIPAKSITVNDLAIQLDNMQYFEDFTPDIVVIDYADLLASRVQGEERHKLDDIWSNLRRIALQRNICIITASQANRGSIGEDLSIGSVAEDFRKVAHVTKMIGINASKEEKANGIFRISQVAERDDETTFEQAYVTSCLPLGAAFLDSRFRSEVWVDKSKKL